MAKHLHHPDCVVGSAAARTNAGREIVIDWPDATLAQFTARDLYLAKENLVSDGIATRRDVPNGYGGWDAAYIKKPLTRKGD